MRLDPDYLTGVAAVGTPDFYALLFAKKQEREYLRIMLAMEHVLAQISSSTAEAGIRQAKLGWWAGELDRLSTGDPAHPVTVAVHEVLALKGLSAAPVLELFAAIVREASDEWPRSPGELLGHAQQRGAVIELAAAVIGNPAKLADLSLKPFAALGRARFLAVSVGGGHQCIPEGPPARDAGQTAMLAQLASAQRQELDTALREIPVEMLPEFVPLLTMAALVGLRLDVIANDPASRPRSQLSKLMLAWRAARAASRGKLPV